MVSLPLIVDTIISNLLKSTANSISRTIDEIATSYSTSVFLGSLFKDDNRYIEAIIQSHAISDNHLNELPKQLRVECSKQLLELLGEWQANQVQRQLPDIRNFFEQRDLSNIFSREETYNILSNGQKKHRLLVLVAPPHISPHCPSSLQHDLPIELPEKLKTFLHRDYPLNSDLCPVEFYGDYFMRAISDTDILQLQQILPPIPTVVLHSKITDYEVYFHANFWHPNNSKIAKINLPTWNWEEAYEALQAADYNETRAIRTIRQIIVTLHQLLAALLTDWYYLHLNHLYEPQLFDLEPELAIGQCSSDLLKPYTDILHDFYLQQKQAYQETLNYLIHEKSAKFSEINIGVEKSIIKPEYFRISQDDIQIFNNKFSIDYSNLQLLLSEKNWQAADIETTKIIFTIASQQINNLNLELPMMNQILFSGESIANFPCEDLRIIDKLWLNYSNLHFGFSIQTCIWQRASQASEDLNLKCKDFTEHVAWIVNGKWLKDEQINYSLEAPLGHLPFDFTNLFLRKDLKNINNWGCWYELYDRIQSCAI
ncbi:WD40 domain-containing protein [Tolypothrix tenuis PCC 7101]|uniref:WD40 domain-containing protein n=1 Tax=Tolypothrix tenuis PCC 7101 TaxID=231146 RepID=A0A1Z4N8X7_9CYAN|nr:WD40 domain-containing protein [Tolypothrix tenuis PCC 7101]BAZ73900.1 WD40 domain-containing protein [Aulosira laxa NIES-50]